VGRAERDGLKVEDVFQKFQRLLIATVVPLALGLAAPAFSQTSPPPAPPMSKAEADAAIMAYYPAKARAAGVEGTAYLKCGLSDRARLVGCTLSGEYPKSYGFGDAALALSKLSRDNPEVPAKPRPNGQEVEFKFSLNPARISPNTLIPTHFQAPTSWLARPSAGQFFDVFPERAQRAGVSGRVILDCGYADTKLSDCRISQEKPVGWGFGASALRLTDYFRLKPPVVDGEIDTNARVELPVGFVAR